MKKLLMTLGSITSAAIPTIATVSCFDEDYTPLVNPRSIDLTLNQDLVSSMSKATTTNIVGTTIDPKFNDSTFNYNVIKKLDNVWMIPTISELSTLSSSEQELVKAGKIFELDGKKSIAFVLSTSTDFNNTSNPLYIKVDIVQRQLQYSIFSLNVGAVGGVGVIKIHNDTTMRPWLKYNVFIVTLDNSGFMTEIKGFLPRDVSQNF